jgi:alkylated DNA repair protein (DNA oxidative demethylase)
MNLDLFPAPEDERHAIGEQAWLLRGFACSRAPGLVEALEKVTLQAPWRNMVTPGGFTMSVAMTNCGELGWTTDRRGYRYSATDPMSKQAWPPMPTPFRQLAREAAAAAGFDAFDPDACLANRYLPGTRLTLHQDRNERDMGAPIVSVSLGMPAVFLFGGLERSDKASRIPLFHGDVVVWGGVDRLRYHGILPLKDTAHEWLGSQRINLTFRKAG